MRTNRHAARKRRIALIRQLALVVEPTSPVDPWVQAVPSRKHILEFAEECRASLPLRLVVHDERTGQGGEVLLERSFAILGTADNCDVRLPHPDVSRQHAYLQVVGGRVLLCDLGSRTGLHFAGQSRTRGWLLPGGAVQIGPFTVSLARNEFADDSASGAESTNAGDASVRQPARYVLDFLNAHSRTRGKRQSRIKHQVNLVGWNHLCNLRLQHHTVERVHCGLVDTGKGLWLVDLRSSVGTQVNDERIELSRLAEGDRIGIGRFELVVGMRELGADSVVLAGDAHSGAGKVTKPRASDSHGDGDVFVSDAPGEPREPSGLTATPKTLAVPAAPLMPMLPMPPFAGGLSTAGMPGGGSLSDGMAMAMMQQFALMQQQLFEHTQHLLTSVVQAFHSAHHSQLDLIREELGRLHELNRELQELNAKKSQASAEPDPGPCPAPQAAAEPAQPRRPLPRAAHTDPEFAPRADAAREEEQPADVHGWLNSRIRQLEKERTSRWQRIMQMLTSGSSS